MSSISDVALIRDLETQVAEQAEWIKAAEMWILAATARLERLEGATPPAANEQAEPPAAKPDKEKRGSTPYQRWKDDAA